MTPSNNLDGVRMSTAMTYLNPVRHHLNLTVRGGVFVRKIVVKNGKAVGKACSTEQISLLDPGY